MDNKIYNYSFHPVTEHAKKLGIVELEERVSFALKENFDFEYPLEDDQKVSAHLKHVRSLPKDTREMY